MPINDAPEFTLPGNPDDGDDWDSEVDDQTVTTTITDVSNPTLFAAGPAIDEGDLTFTPADDANGEAVIEITVTDDGGTENEGDDDTTVDTFTITIDPVNDAPVALDDEYTTSEDIGLTVGAAEGLLVAGDDDYDVDEDAIEVVATTVVTAEGGSAALAADGSFSYAPPSGFFGTDTFTYTVTDGVATSAPATVTILVAEDDNCVALASLPFTDVPAGAFYEAAVQWAVSCGVTSGFTPTSFGPQVSVNRAQFLTFLWRAAGEPVPAGGENFVDVNPGDYFYDAVRWAVNVENPVTTGTTTTTFSPELTINRAQAMTLLHRYVGSPTPAGGENFVDVNPGDFFYDAVRWAVNADSPVTSGTTATTFSPANQATRAEALTFIYRAIG